MSLYDIIITDNTDKETTLAEYRDQVLLIVNTASTCGFTPQFDGLETLYQQHKDAGFVVLGFPCNQFGDQDPGSTADSINVCRENYGVSFPMFAKVDVNGPNAAPLFTYLKQQQAGLLGSRIKWNFTKFLIDRKGNVVKRYGSTTTPEQIEADIQKLL